MENDKNAVDEDQTNGYRRSADGLQSEAEANHYMREAWRKGKSLKNASAQWIGYGIMVVLQRTVKPMVGVEHQTTTLL